MLPGNISEPGTLAAALQKLRREDRDAGAGEEEEPDRDASAEEKPGEDEARLCVWSHRR